MHQRLPRLHSPFLLERAAGLPQGHRRSLRAPVARMGDGRPRFQASDGCRSCFWVVVSVVVSVVMVVVVPVLKVAMLARRSPARMFSSVAAAAACLEPTAYCRDTSAT